MKTITEPIIGIQTTTRKGTPLLTNNGTVRNVIIITGSHPNGIWATANSIPEKAEVVTYRINEKGDTFIAQNDSKTLQTEGKEKGKPLFLKGDVVTRQQDSIEYISCGQQNVTKFSSEQDKLAFLVSAGAKFSI